MSWAWLAIEHIYWLAILTAFTLVVTKYFWVVLLSYIENYCWYTVFCNCRLHSIIVLSTVEMCMFWLNALFVVVVSRSFVEAHSCNRCVRINTAQQYLIVCSTVCFTLITIYTQIVKSKYIIEWITDCKKEIYHWVNHRL